MEHDLSTLSPEQLGRLFPIILSGHDPLWAQAYADEVPRITALFGPESIIRISHIGSTAIKGIIAKPTIDMLVEVAPTLDIAALNPVMEDHGYGINTPPGDLVTYIKGYTPRGFEGQAFHIHVRHSGDWGELYFRDYLNEHPETAAEYAALKQRLYPQYTYDRDGYTAAKGDFISRVTQRARAAYPGRYIPQA